MDIRYTRGFDEICLSQWIRDPKIAVSCPSTSESEQKNFVRTWMHYAQKKAGLSIVSQDINVGMGVFILMPYQKVSHHAILQIVINPDFQKKGFGSALLKNMLHLAKDYLHLELVFMEFFGTPESLAFLEKRGFKTYAVQKDYVNGMYPDKFLLEYLL